ncbi:MAG: M1 family metallopeptidase [Saprospirales bacterium]|nr:M1 family metallopeptidase [Saprospirales bacterium]MBK8492272.1 M1 family metallopeptidase [Saprospirales bacterium]
MKQILFLLALFLVQTLGAQPNCWQQRVQYEMDIDFEVKTHQYSGTQKLTYFNESPDQLDRVFYHLYLNAFQPGSAMDVRSRTIPDPDFRVLDRISRLKPDEIGYQKIISLTQDGKPLTYHVEGTILEVALAVPIEPGDSTVFEMEFEAQVPPQIRRNGRDSEEGVDYSMSQWYPKMCNYDYQGWHANPYIAREFYGIFGSFDVTIHIDRNYVVAATGYLQNPQETGYGYENIDLPLQRPKGEKLTWHFYAPQVHDFVWAADTEYTHTQLVRPDGVTLHFFFLKNGNNLEEWARLPKVMDTVLSYLNDQCGKYPYQQFSFIQGGDGGMEYPMATLITGNRSFGSLVGTSVHEMIHSWYPMVLGTNEALYPWMDEGFTTYFSNETMNYLRAKGMLPGEMPRGNPMGPTYAGYLNLVRSGLEEPLTTHADHYQTNYAYGQAAYDKGAVFLHQLSYVVGMEAFRQGMLDYFKIWQFHHPNVNDFIRVMEKASGLELDWYKEYFVQTTLSPDYGIEALKTAGPAGSLLVLNRVGAMPMPVDVEVTTLDGKRHLYNIPLDIMRGAKLPENTNLEWTVAPDWMWVQPSYELELPFTPDQIKTIEIDPSSRMADINRSNNIKEAPWN